MDNPASVASSFIKNETALTKRYETVREHISYRLKDVQAINFATDIRISDVCWVTIVVSQVLWVNFMGIIYS